MKRVKLGLVALLCLPLLMPAQDLRENLKEFEKNVAEFTLPNGMHFIVLERHQAPVVSFHAYVNVGSVNDPAGRTGLAHMFEHMIGKGTPTVGTKNWTQEEESLKGVEAAYRRVEEERRKEFRADPAKVKELQASLDSAIKKANEFVVPNQFVQVIEENGAAGFNAGTALDATQYFYSLPSNRAELWFLLQSEWFKQPVYREFYKERDVVREERRMRTESNPVGQLQEMLLSTAFTAQPYRTVVGWGTDIENLTATDAQEFFKTYYVPSNITVAIAGDITTAQAKKLAEKYYGPLPAGPLPPRMRTLEPKQNGEKRVTVETPSQPFLLIAWHRPDQYDKDDAVFDVLEGVLSSGRTGLLYKTMVQDKRLALQSGASATFPSGKYSSLFLVYSVPNQGKTVDENEKALYAVIDQLKKEKVDPAALVRVKTKIRAGLIRRLDGNSGLASQLAEVYANYGDWRKMFTSIEDVDKVTADDIQRVVKTYFIDESKTVAYTVAPKSAQESK
ncbi:MAG: pitrilysin family protein [Bryobacteraceae bacterium]